MKFSRWDLLLTLWVGFVVGSTEPPWFWETWATVGVFILYVTIKATKEES